MEEALLLVKRKFFSLLSAIWLLVLATTGLATAQNSQPKGSEVSGRVVDAVTSEPLLGCAVVIKGTTQGATTDGNGKFVIKIPDGNTVLVFSFIGYEKQEIIVNNQREINVLLAPGAKELSQVVVIGYGSTTKRDMTGSVKSIKETDFNQGIITSPEQMLQGKISGVNVTSVSGEPGSQQGITIRGPGGIRTGSTPLFVLDGFALDNSTTGGAINPLTFLPARPLVPNTLHGHRPVARTSTQACLAWPFASQQLINDAQG